MFRGVPNIARARVPLQIPSRMAALYDGVQLLADGDAEDPGVGAWIVGGVGAVASKELNPRSNSPGIRALRITAAGVTATVSQTILTKGRFYHTTGWLIGSVDSTITGIRDGTGSVLVPLTTSYVHFSVYFRARASGMYLLAVPGQWAQVDDWVVAEVGTEDIRPLKTTCNCRVNVPLEDGMIGQHLPDTFRLGTLGRGVRVHPAATQLLTYSDLSLNGTLTGLTLTKFFERDLHRLIETAANSEHKISRPAAATLAANTLYTLSLYGRLYPPCIRQIRVRVTTPAAANFDHTFDVTTTNAAYSYSFTTGASDAGACTVEIALLKAGADSYAGDTMAGFILGQIVQLEAGNASTPHIYTYNATASSVAPVYDAMGCNNWLYDWLSSPRFDFEMKCSTWVATAGVLPLWSIDWGATAAVSNLTYQGGVGFSHNLTNIGGAAWAPQLDHVYRIRLVMDPGGDGVFQVIDITDDAMDLEITFSDRNWHAPSTRATAVLLGCDAAGAGQWNMHLVEAA